MTLTRTMPSETVGQAGRATLSDVWPLITPLLMGQAPPERPLPALARVDVSIRPMNPNAWPKGTFDEEL